jgi:hypothetical protein
MEAVGSKPELIDRRSSGCQRNARLLVYPSQGLVCRTLQELDETTFSTVHFEGPEVRPEFASHAARGGHRILIGNTVRWIDEPEPHPQAPRFAHEAASV